MLENTSLHCLPTSDLDASGFKIIQNVTLWLRIHCQQYGCVYIGTSEQTKGCSTQANPTTSSANSFMYKQSFQDTTHLGDKYDLWHI